jgi:hypothetical protein
LKGVADEDALREVMYVGEKSEYSLISHDHEQLRHDHYSDHLGYFPEDG